MTLFILGLIVGYWVSKKLEFKIEKKEILEVENENVVSLSDYKEKS